MILYTTATRPVDAGRPQTRSSTQPQRSPRLDRATGMKKVAFESPPSAMKRPVAQALPRHSSPPLRPISPLSVSPSPPPEALSVPSPADLSNLAQTSAAGEANIEVQLDKDLVQESCHHLRRYHHALISPRDSKIRDVDHYHFLFMCTPTTRYVPSQNFRRYQTGPSKSCPRYFTRSVINWSILRRYQWHSCTRTKSLCSSSFSTERARLRRLGGIQWLRWLQGEIG